MLVIKIILYAAKCNLMESNSHLSILFPDRDIGFGPSMVDEQQTVQADVEQNMISHPAPPPITGTEGVDRDEEVVVQEGNFFLVKPVDGEDPPTLVWNM